MNAIKMGLIGILGAGILAGCASAESSAPKETKKIEAGATKEDTVDPKTWKDLSSDGGIEKIDFSPNAKNWVSDTLEEFNRPAEKKLLEAGLDEGYDYYLKAMGVLYVLGSFIRVEGKDIEKDFENLRILAGIIHHEQFVRTAHIDPNGQAIEKLDVAQDWKPISKRTTISFDYMKKILHDIDIAINKGGEGETFGVTHQLDGEHVQEMEAFMEHDDEDDY